MNSLLLSLRTIFRITQLKNKGQVLIDLGAGEMVDGYVLACLIGARAYIGVEPFYADKLLNRLTVPIPPEIVGNKDRNSKDYELHLANRILSYKPWVSDSLLDKADLTQIQPIPIFVAAEDARTFLRRLPNQSASLLTCGTIHIVAGGSYTKEVRSEIKRVLSPNGLHISNISAW